MIEKYSNRPNQTYNSSALNADLANFKHRVMENPGDCSLRMSLGSLYDMLGDHSNAACQYIAAARIDPNQADVIEALVGIFMCSPDLAQGPLGVEIATIVHKVLPEYWD